MREEITVGVSLRKEDMKLYFFASNRKRLLFTSIIYLLITLPLSAVMILDFGAFVWGALFFALMLVFCSGVLAIATFIRYHSFMNEFEHNKNFDKILSYDFNAQGYAVNTPDGHLTMHWSNIARIIDLKPCYVIVRSMGKLNLLPKRCFNGAPELNAFRELLIANVESKKLKLRNEDFNHFSPDTVEMARPLTIQAEEKHGRANDETPHLEFSFTLTKKEIIKYNLLFYYMRSLGCLLTVLGLLLLIPVVRIFGGETELPLLTQIVVTFLCAYLLPLAPALIYVMSVRNYKADTSLRNSTTYRFYSDHMTASNDRGISDKHYADFRKLSKLGPFYLLFITKRLAYIIPERAVEDKAAFDDFFRFLKQENRRLNSYAMTNTQPPADEPSLFCTNCGVARPSPAHKYCANCGKEYINK